MLKKFKCISNHQSLFLFNVLSMIKDVTVALSHLLLKCSIAAIPKPLSSSAMQCISVRTPPNLPKMFNTTILVHCIRASLKCITSVEFNENKAKLPATIDRNELFSWAKVAKTHVMKSTGSLGVARTVARKFSMGGLCVSVGGFGFMQRNLTF